MPHRFLYLPMEIFPREYLGKLALACYVVNPNVSVIFGYNHRVRQLALDAAQAGVYYEIKGRTQVGMEYLDQLRQSGFKLVAQDEEAGIAYRNWEDFVFWRQEASGTEFFDLFFSWGPKDYEGYSRKSHKENIRNTGSPRSVFWGHFGLNFYEEKVVELKELMGDYILIITGFATKNSLLSMGEVKKQYSQLGYNRNSWEARKSRISWQSEAEKLTFALIDKLVSKTNKHIVIRPHPAEDDSVWRNRYDNNERITVTKNGESLPMVLAASAVFHTGSTVAFESISCGIPTFNYACLIGNGISSMSTNDLSINIEDLEEVGAIFDKSTSRTLNWVQLHNLEPIVSGIGTTRSLDEQAKYISDLVRNLPLGTSQEKVSDESKRPLIDFDRFVSRLRYGRSSYSRQHSHKRPNIELSRVEEDVKRLSNIFRLRKDFLVEELSESTFKLELLISDNKAKRSLNSLENG